MKKLKWWWFRRKNWYSHRDELDYYWNILNLDPELTPRETSILIAYTCWEETLEQIADQEEVTRERVRVFLEKIRRKFRNDIKRTKR